MAKEKKTYWLGSLKVTLVDADAAEQACDAIITAVDCGGMWSGGVNSAVNSLGGPEFHRLAREYPARFNGDSIIFRRIREHTGGFRDVIVMYDGLTCPLGGMVVTALSTADYAGLKVVCLPALRTGSRLGRFEPDVSAVVREIVTALKNVAARHRQALQEVIVAVRGNKEVFVTLAYDLERAQFG